MSDIRIPPQSVQAEQALLGSIVIKQDSLFEIIEYIHKDVFYEPKHGIIFEAIMDLSHESSPVDLLTLSDKLTTRQQLDQVGGQEYLALLATSVPSAANIEHYAGIVHDRFIKRELIAAGEEVSQTGYDESLETEVALDQAEKTVFRIAQSMGSSEFHNMVDLARDAGERLMALQDGGDKMRGIPTGFTSLDRKLSGFQPSDLIILAARPSVGKTSLALDFVRKISVNHHKSIAFFSLEMSKDQLIDRMLAAESRVDYWKMRTGTIKDQADFGALQDAIGRLSEAQIHIDDNSYNNILRMKSAARKLKRKHGLDLLVVDYLQLMAPVKSGPNVSVVQEVTEISRGLKQLAKELEVPVIALSQLSRNIEHRGTDARPKLADLRDSGSIEQDADLVMFIHRPKSDEEQAGRGSQTELIIEKHRNGATGVVELFFDAEKTTFHEVDGQYDQQVADFDAEQDNDEF